MPRVSWSHPPYPGLAFFDREEWPIYFGRETELEHLIKALAGDRPDHPGPPFLVVVGASGSGKSSLVRAGLWARLAAGRVPELPGGEHWLVTAMTPADPIADNPLAVLRARTVQAIGSHPELRRLARCDWHTWMRRIARRETSLADLAEALLDGSPQGARWLLILDQMEELFTACPVDASNLFIDRLADAISPCPTGEPPRLQVIATLRADFFQHCVAHRDLRPLVQGAGSFLLGSPERLALERMIEAPVNEIDVAEPNAAQSAVRAPWAIAPALVHRLAAEADGCDGGLALMSFVLRELYETCRAERRIDMVAYEALGGLGGAIAERANAELKKLGAGAEKTLTRVIGHLIHVGEDDAPTRRRAERATWECDEEAKNLIDAFIHARLLVGGDDGKGKPTVEIAHEALLRAWPLLVKWINDSREALRLRDRVQQEARVWVDQGRPPVRLWKHEILDPARRLLAEVGLLAELERKANIADFLIPEANWLLAELYCGETGHARRDAIGMRLSDIGDPRPGVGVVDSVPDILWCEMPAGEVEIESQGRIEVTPFRIAAYPVTYAQYRAFVEAEDGYRLERWWADLSHEAEPGRQLRPYTSYPADNVSWRDATAFCRWLSSRVGMEIRLPDEWEWQWAAQSARGEFHYPWGGEWREGFANTAEAWIGRTIAVGMYPAGRSIQGAFDLAGNLWESCRKRYEDLHKRERSGDLPRVLRGGSWKRDRGSARAANRGHNRPGARGGYYGFRVLCDFPIR